MEQPLWCRLGDDIRRAVVDPEALRAAEEMADARDRYV